MAKIKKSALRDVIETWELCIASEEELQEKGWRHRVDELHACIGDILELIGEDV